MNQRTISLRTWVDMILLALIWGAIFLVIEFALKELTPFWAVAHRVFWAAPVLWFVVYARGRAMPRAASAWAGFFVMGALNNAIPFSLITWGQTEIESGLASILNGTTAFFGMVVAAAFLADERLTARKSIGVVLGVIGVAVIMGLDTLGGLDPRALGQLAILGAAISYAFAGVWARLRLTGMKPEIAAAGMLTCSAGQMLAIALVAEGPPLLALTTTTIGAIAYMSLLGTAAAYLLFYRILASAGSGNLMLVTVVMPPISVLLGWAVLGERLSATDLIGCALILIGLMIVDGKLLKWVAGRKRQA